MATSPSLDHWFIIPVCTAGILIGVDAVQWFRTRPRLFDPVGLVGLFGWFFFFLAPLLHAYWDHWMPLAPAPPDWRTWLGMVSALNVLGLCVYRVTLARYRFTKPMVKRRWYLDERRLWAALCLALLASVILQVSVYRSLGGFAGFVAAATGVGEASLDGYGGIFAVSESFPILFLVAGLMLLRSRQSQVHWGQIMLLLACFTIAIFIFGGLRTSRSNVIFQLFAGVGLVHFFLRRIQVRVLIIVIPLLIAFMYFLGFYKALGPSELSYGTDGRSLAVLEERSGRTLQLLLLADLGRADVQANVLYGSLNRYSAPELGGTYLYALTALLPDSISVTNLGVSKVDSGTRVLYGEDALQRGWQSSQVYGLAGEAVLNWSWMGVPFVFIPWALLVAWCDARIRGLTPDDPRAFFAPLFCLLPIVALSSDVSNVIFYLIKYWAVLGVVVILSCRRV